MGLRAEDVAAAGAAAMSFIASVIAVVLQMKFVWGAAFVILTIVTVKDWCLRSDVSKRHLRQPLSRITASTGATIVIGLMFWPSLRREYMNEHVPPSFAYVVPGYWSPSTVPQWFMLVRHYGPHTVFNAELLFLDNDRAETLRRSVRPLTPQDIEQEQLVLHFPEIDKTTPIYARRFGWSPLEPAHEHYSIVSVSRHGRFDESLSIERANNKWFWEMTIREQPAGKIIVYCRDAGFPATHIDSPETPSCFPDFAIKHKGDAALPFQLPSNDSDAAMAVAVLIFAVLVLWPFYGMAACWWMGATSLILPHNESES